MCTDTETACSKGRTAPPAHTHNLEIMTTYTALTIFITLTTTTNRKAYRHRLELAYLLQLCILYQQIHTARKLVRPRQCLCLRPISKNTIPTNPTLLHTNSSSKSGHRRARSGLPVSWVRIVWSRAPARMLLPAKAGSPCSIRSLRSPSSALGFFPPYNYLPTGYRRGTRSPPAGICTPPHSTPPPRARGTAPA